MPNRYARHLALPGFGPAEQLQLSKARVLVVGAGGLGCPALLYLAAAGVGSLGILDPDTVSLSNLQRQILFRESDIGQPKATLAARQIRAYNSEILVQSMVEQVHRNNVEALLQDYDYVLDATDNFPARYLLNDASVLFDKTYIYGSIHQFEGQVAVFNQLRKDGSRGPNYRDLFPVPPLPEAVPDCAAGGVLGILPGIIGTMQASETIKCITGIGQSLNGQLWLFDAENMISRKMDIPKRADTSIQELIDYDLFCGHTPLPEDHNLSAKQIREWIQTSRPHRLIDVRSLEEYQEFHLEAEHLPLDQLTQHVPELINAPIDIVFYCQSGQRSRKALELLFAHGRTKGLFHLKDGLSRF
ncbi:MAG: ThiF family adenylyltransferase [Saprospiraceae bacterium]|nr:ThiF family adenylyltransferase [Saprospiraceae bacterium]